MGDTDNPPGMTLRRDAWRLNGLYHRQPARHESAAGMIGGGTVPGTDNPPGISDGCHAWRVVGGWRRHWCGRIGRARVPLPLQTQFGPARAPLNGPPHNVPIRASFEGAFILRTERTERTERTDRTEPMPPEIRTP